MNNIHVYKFCVEIGKLQNSEWITFIVIFKRTSFDVSLFYSISYFFINKRVHIYALHVFSLLIYLMKLHEFFFLLSSACRNFFVVQFLA